MSARVGCYISDNDDRISSVSPSPTLTPAPPTLLTSSVVSLAFVLVSLLCYAHAPPFSKITRRRSKRSHCRASSRSTAPQPRIHFVKVESRREREREREEKARVTVQVLVSEYEQMSRVFTTLAAHHESELDNNELFQNTQRCLRLAQQKYIEQCE